MAEQKEKKGTSSPPEKREIARPTVGGIRNIWSSYPSSGLTPEKLAAILKEADQGDIYRQMELFEEMEEKDPHLFSVLQTRKRAVSNLPWEIVPASDADRDKEIAEAVRQQIAYIPRFKKALRDLLDAIGKGFAVSEIMWDIADGEVYVEELKCRHQKWFTFDRETGQEIRLLTDADSFEGEPLPEKKFIVARFEAKSGLPSRGGILRICAWMYLFKNYGVKDWVSFAEAFGMPLRLGKYPAGSSEEDRNVLLQAVTNIGQDAAATIPEGMAVEFIETVKSIAGSTHEGLPNFCDRQISKAVLGQTLTSDSGGEGSGSYALGKVHQNVRFDLIESDAEELAEAITEHLVRPLVEFNFGEQDMYPEFKLIAKAQEDLNALADTVEKLTRSGLRISAAEIREKFGFRNPEDDEEILQTFLGGQQGIPMSLVTSSPLFSGKNLSGNAKPPEQTVDAYTKRLLREAAVDQLLEPVERLLEQAGSLEVFQDMISAAFSEYDPTEIGNILQKALAAAELAGRWEATEDAG